MGSMSFISTTSPASQKSRLCMNVSTTALFKRQPALAHTTTLYHGVAARRTGGAIDQVGDQRRRPLRRPLFPPPAALAERRHIGQDSARLLHRRRHWHPGGHCLLLLVSLRPQSTSEEAAGASSACLSVTGRRRRFFSEQDASAHKILQKIPVTSCVAPAFGPCPFSRWLYEASWP